MFSLIIFINTLILYGMFYEQINSFKQWNAGHVQ